MEIAILPSTDADILRCLCSAVVNTEWTKMDSETKYTQKFTNDIRESICLDSAICLYSS